MRYAKVVGVVAAVAMAGLSLLAAASASATVLCKSSLTSGCAAAGSDYASGTFVAASLLEGTYAFLRPTAWEPIIDHCTKSTIGIATTSTGGAAATVGGELEAANLWFGGCTEGPTNLASAAIEIHHIAGTDNGTLVGTGLEVKTVVAGVTCYYAFLEEGTIFGILTGGSPATIDVNAILFLRTKPEFGTCPTDLRWEGKYAVNSPKPLYVAAS